MSEKTIKIRLLTSVSGSDYSYAAGAEVDAPEDRAKDLVRARYADLVAEKPADRRETVTRKDKGEKR